LLLNLGWSPVVHWQCVPGDRLLVQEFYAPGVVANSPYGGRVWANGTFPWNPSSISGAGGNESNGGSFADFSSANFSIFPAVNQTAWGPGPNGRCTTPYLVQVAQTPSIALQLLSLLPEGTLSDSNAPIQLPPQFTITAPSVVFGDRFLGPNVDYIDTCGLSIPADRTVSVPSITVGLPVSLPTGAATVPATLPVTSTYHYWFPANFGVWIIDDLSANGYLPGSGWAFEYHHCT
ncbi:MAG: hypothetical protein L3J73_04670, partial [Thermoplasmata archaeon]|nr:hypothetical protein [Thermoplasmata archaeon]